MKIAATIAAGALLAGWISLTGAAVASAENLHNVIDSDGTQGEFTDSVAGEWDTDGTQTEFDDDGYQADDSRSSVVYVPQGTSP